jgi:hypothetical protein
MIVDGVELAETQDMLIKISSKTMFKNLFNLTVGSHLNSQFIIIF